MYTREGGKLNRAASSPASRDREVRMRIVAALIGTGLFATAAAAAISGEFLQPPMTPGFALGWSNPSGQMREYIPHGETVARWTQMITVQQLGYRPGLTPERFLDRWTAGFGRACQGAVIGTVTSAPLGEHAGARVRIDCSRNSQTGLSETIIGRAVMGDDQLHMIQAAARRAFTVDDERWADTVLSSVTLCAAAANNAQCATARTDRIGALP